MRKTYYIFVAALIGVALLVGIGIDAGQPVKKIRIIYSNDTSGYAESCGCGGRKDGGLALRAHAIAQLVKDNPNCVIVESGNISDRAEKLDLIASILSELGYDAVGMGMFDYRLAEEYLRQTATRKFAVLDASPGAPESTKPYFIKEIDGVKVGVFSFNNTPAGRNDDFAMRRSLYGAYKAVRDASDILVVLDQANTVNKEWLEGMGERFGAPDIVVSGTAKSYQKEAEAIGKTWIVPTATQGRAIGHADIELAPGQEPKIVVRKVELLQGMPDDEAIRERIRTALRKPAQAVTASPGTATSTNPTQSQPQGHNNAYYPAHLCKMCHEKEYKSWAESGHAHAIKTLVDDGRVVPECLACHSEAFRRTQSMVIPANALGGVDCSTCHHEALPHGMERKDITRKTKVSPKLCLNCHTKERSPDYDEEMYFPMVTHGK